MAEGDLKQSIKVTGRDELSQVANNFNSMASQLAASYEVLEKKVKERTKEYKLANQELQRLKDELETIVSKRTAELKDKVRKLDKSQKPTYEKRHENKVYHNTLLRTERHPVFRQ